MNRHNKIKLILLLYFYRKWMFTIISKDMLYIYGKQIVYTFIGSLKL